MRNRLALITFVVLGLIVFWGRPIAAQDQSLYAKSYDVDITVLPNGDMRVVERQTIVFTSGSFHMGYAAIPLDRTEGITDIQVVADGVKYNQATSGEQPGTFTTEQDGNDLVINWYFKYTSNSTHVYELHYTVKGGLRYYPEYGEVWWKAIPPDHPYVIRASTVRVKLPAGATILQDATTGKDYAGAAPDVMQVKLSEDRLQATFTATRMIGQDQEVEVRVRFTPGVVAGQAPAWQKAFDRQQEWDTNYRPLANLLLGLAGAASLIGGPLLVLGLWYMWGRDPSVGLVADMVAQPPADLPAGLVGALVDERADLQDILATLIDLARRGYLTITEEKGRGVLSTRDYIYRRTDKPLDDLRHYEKLFIGEFFGGRAERRLSELRNKFYASLPKLQHALYQELVKEKFFSASPESVRQRYGCLGMLALALAIGGGILALSSSSVASVDTLWCPFAGLGVTAIALIISGNYMPHKTRLGAEAAAVWRAFKNYLANIEKYDLPQARERFEEYLPYAVAFGLERSLIRKFASVEAPMPTWYMPYPHHRPPYVPSGGHGQVMPAPTIGTGELPSVQQMSDSMAGSLQSMSDGLISMFNSASRTLTSQPSSSGSSSGSRGWSGGGGFRGGGGGGGGSRGFR